MNNFLDSSGIAALARLTKIHCGDETAVVSTYVRGRSYAPTGKTTATFTAGGTRQKLSMITTVTSRGMTRGMIIDEEFNSDKLIDPPRHIDSLY